MSLFQSQAASLHAGLSGEFLSFTHPNEQLREINASNCQTIKSYIRGRIPQPPAEELATDIAIITTLY